MTNHHTPSGRPLLRRAAAFAVAAVALAAPAVAGTTLPAHAADAAPAVKVAIATDIDTFNPFLAILASSTGILRFQYENLVQYGVNNEPVPGLSDKWETSTDGKTWTYHIRDGMKWSDSQPLTADDVAWTFNAVKTNPALQKANGGLVENVQSVAAKDPSTLELTLTAPQASNPGFELPIVPKHVWEKQADPSKYANDTDTVGSGPFTIKSYQKGVSVQLVANPNFWRGPAKVSGLTYAYYKNTDAAVQALKNGEVDIVGSLTPAQFTSLKDQSGITASRAPGAATPRSPSTPARSTRRASRSVTATLRSRTRAPPGDRQGRRQADPADPRPPGPGQAGPDRDAGRLPQLHRVCRRLHRADLRHRRGEPAARPGRLRQGRRRQPDRQVRQAADPAPDGPQLRPDARADGGVRQGLAGPDRHPARRSAW